MDTAKVRLPSFCERGRLFVLKCLMGVISKNRKSLRVDLAPNLGADLPRIVGPGMTYFG